MKEAMVSGAMVSWIIGGYPGLMLKASGEAAFNMKTGNKKSTATEDTKNFLTRMAGLSWRPGLENKILTAWKHFEKAFYLYPCSNQVFYYGPITRSPAYKLHLEKEKYLAIPYNWGISRDRVKQPFEDDVNRWRGEFSPEELIKSFRTMAGEWRKGTALLNDIVMREPKNNLYVRQEAVAKAALIQFESAANVIEFYFLRDRLLAAPGIKLKKMLDTMITAVKSDISLAREMSRLMRLDANIGFQSEINGYSFTPALLHEKIRHDEETLKTLVGFQKNGLNAELLHRFTDTPEAVQQEKYHHCADWKKWIDSGD